VFKALEALQLEQHETDRSHDDTKQLRELKARLAETVLKIQSQFKLSGMKDGGSAPQVLTPPTEPAGRAPVGMAYEA